MNELVIQVQPQRLPSFADVGVAQLRSAATAQGVDGVEVREDADQSVNLIFTTRKADALWPALSAEIARLGWQDGVVAACTGAHGWGDYKLLHHYDPKIVGG